jgi:DNA-binding transcriptional MerR regulator
MSDPGVLSIGQIAEELGCEAWQVRRLFQRGLLPPAARVGPFRVATRDELPVIEKALRKAGYLPGKAVRHA